MFTCCGTPTLLRVAAYRDLDPQIKPLGPLLETYQTCLAAARNRGRSEVLAKKPAQEALLEQLDAFCGCH